MTSWYIAAVAGSALGSVLTAIVVLFKGRAEHGNLTVDSAQKAVAAMSGAMDELTLQLDRARKAANVLQHELDDARNQVHDLKDLLDAERLRADELEHQLDELHRRLPD